MFSHTFHIFSCFDLFCFVLLLDLTSLHACLGIPQVVHTTKSSRARQAQFSEGTKWEKHVKVLGWRVSEFRRDSDPSDFPYFCYPINLIYKLDSELDFNGWIFKAAAVLHCIQTVSSQRAPFELWWHGCSATVPETPGARHGPVCFASSCGRWQRVTLW